MRKTRNLSCFYKLVLIQIKPCILINDTLQKAQSNLYRTLLELFWFLWTCNLVNTLYLLYLALMSKYGILNKHSKIGIFVLLKNR